MNNTTCMICGSFAAPYLNKDGYRYMRCTICNLFFMDPLPTPDDLSLFYGKDYFEEPADNVRAYRCGYDSYDESTSFKKPFYGFLFSVINRCGARHILDVGAAYGGFVAFLNERGISASGIEISEFAAKRAQQNGINVGHASLESFADNTGFHGFFDMVCMLDVFEHFYDHAKALAGARALLGHGGMLLIVTPSSRSITARLLKKKWYHFLPPQHTYLFNENNIADLLARLGFRVTETSYVSKQFSLRYFLHIFEGWTHIKLPKYFARRFGNLIFTFPLRDNMMIIAQKI